MQLDLLLKGIYDHPVPELQRDADIRSISSDSRKVEKNGLFVALKGFAFDGNDFIRDAIARGASVVVGERPVNELGGIDLNGAVYIAVDNSFEFLRKLAFNFYGHPSREVRCIGITGTNGKTTIAYLIESILHENAHSCSVIGTVNYRMFERLVPSTNTTPGFLDIQKFLADNREEGVEYCVMEVSSHALDQGRVDLVDFKSAVFTNLTSDHLDYHKTRDNYFAAKAKLFLSLSPDACAIINADDAYGRKLYSRTESKLLTYGLKRKADVMAKDIQFDLAGTKFKLVSPEGEIIIRTKLIGQYNVYNILAAVSVCLSENLGLEKIKRGIEKLSSVPGRLERVDCGQDFAVFIDYAHTQDALENVLQTIKHFSDAKIIMVFGCGGDRDKTKRPEMGRVAGQLADWSVVTSDNPRSERPETIIEEIVAGFEQENYEVIVNREEAIKKALKIAKPNDIILIAGKGHETYQIFKDNTISFDERKIIRQEILC